jgi:hypothetical protein
MGPEQGLSASVTGYEVHEEEACITHWKQSPNFYPLNSHNTHTRRNFQSLCALHSQRVSNIGSQ